jgi:hypothetical protein
MEVKGINEEDELMDDEAPFAGLPFLLDVTSSCIDCPVTMANDKGNKIRAHEDTTHN